MNINNSYLFGRFYTYLNCPVLGEHYKKVNNGIQDVRIGSVGQDIENQKFEIFKHANSKGLKFDKFIEETVSTSITFKNRKLGELLCSFKEGDIVLVTEISRFGRSILEVMEIFNQLMSKDVKIYIT